MSADIAGFTQLSERLAGAGRLGAELLSEGIDRCFTSLIGCITPFGGDVLFFGGDALFVAFTGPRHEVRAVAAATDMHGVLRRIGRVTTPGGTTRLAMSVGVATGTAQVVVGDGPQRPLFLVGPTVTRTIDLESRASAGQVLVAPRTARMLPHRERTDIGDAWIVSRRAGRSGDLADPDADGRSGRRAGSMVDIAAQHVPDALRARLAIGDAPREHRRVVIAFIRLRGLDRLSPTARATRVHLASHIIGESCRQLDVCWVSTDVLAGGAKVIIAAGVPQQSDDDELRLVAAAQRVQRSGLGPHLTIGVHRGTAFVGDIGHPERRTYTVMGDTINTAARLMAAAGSGELLASSDVIDHLRGRYRVGAERTRKVKGKRVTVRARTIGATTVPVSGRAPVTLVGRTPELDALHDGLAEHRRGHGRAVEVVAPPGMGKSRLIEAFLTAEPAPDIHVSGELALSVVPFAAIQTAVRQLLDPGSGTSDASDASVVAELATVAGPLAPLVGPVFGVEVADTPEAGAIDAGAVPALRLDLVDRIVAAARPAPGLALIEDVHWLDPSSARLLGGLTERLVDRGWYVISTRRPEVAALTESATTLVLEPLDGVDVRRLAIEASGHRGVDLSDAMLTEMVVRAQGNPLFLEQLVAAVAAGDDVELPESAERVVGARLDMLPAADRLHLRQASVLGTDVDLGLLATIAGDEHLRSVGTWRPLDDFVAVHAGRLRFRQDLFRLAAYEGLAFADRAALHAAAAEQLEHRSDTPAAILARHFERGKRPERATYWAVRAAREATAHAAFSDAVRLWRLAAQSARDSGRSDPVRSNVLLELGRAYELLAEPVEAERAYQEALTLAPAVARPAIRVRLAWVAFRDGRTPVAKRRVTIALREVAAGDGGRRAAVTRVELTLLRAAIREAEGDLRGSERDAAWAAAEARRLRRADLRGEAVMQLALNADTSDDPALARLAAEARRLLARSGKHHELGILELNLAVTLMVKGRWPSALVAFASAADAFTRCGAVLGGISTDANRGGILIEQGRLDEAIVLYDDVARRARAARHTRLAQFAEGSAARAIAWRGDTGTALETLHAESTTLETGGHPDEAGYLRWYLAETLVLAGRFGEARGLVPELLATFAGRPRDQAVDVSLRRLDAIAAHLMGGDDAIGAISEIRRTVELGRRIVAPYEIVRGLHALEALTPDPDPSWATERAVLMSELGVVWLPPVTFATI